MGADPGVDYNAIADRVYIEGWALGLIFGAVDQGLAGSWWPAGLCAVLSAVLQFVVIRWSAWLKAHPENKLIVSVRAITSQARWWIATLAFFLLLIFLSPFVERWPFAARFSTAHSQSADEIAAAVVRALPKAPGPAPFPNVPSAEDNANAVVRKFPYLAAAQMGKPSPIADDPHVNPLSEELTKWRIAASIRTQVLRSDLSADCKITVVRLPVTFAEDCAADFKEIMNVAGWKYDEHFATGTIDKGISIRAISSDATSKRCAQALSTGLRISGRTRTTGNTLRVPEHWLTEPEAPDYLKQCAYGCVEVDIGNDDAQ
jgi:hypothetical protein